MNINDILQLSQAGFTAEQIQALVPYLSQPAQPAQNAQPAQHAQNAQPAQNAQNVQDMNSMDFNQYIQNIQKSIDNLNQTMQANAVKLSTMPETKEQSTDEILASIINPPGTI